MCKMFIQFTITDSGLVDNINVSRAPNKDLEKEAIRVAESIANSGPIAVRAQKALMTQWERLSIKDAIHSGIDVFSEAYESHEPQIMMDPFVKRK